VSVYLLYSNADFFSFVPHIEGADSVMEGALDQMGNRPREHNIKLRELLSTLDYSSDRLILHTFFNSVFWLSFAEGIDIDFVI
jgi:hypothetical protein